MAEEPPGSWPVPEDVALPESEDDQASLIEYQEYPAMQRNAVDSDEKSKGKEILSKINGTIALPSEIRETYAVPRYGLR